MAVTRPDLAAQWHPTRNGDLRPADVVAGAHRKIWWKCPKGPDHEWESLASSRSQGTGCPYCANKRVSVTNSLENYPELAAQWHPTRNGDRTPATVIAGFARKAWWKCPEGPDHEWESTGDSRMSGSGCPFCPRKRRTATDPLSNYPDLAAQWHPTMNGNLTAAMVNGGAHRKVWWKCPKGPDHEWEAQPKSRLAGTGCPYCANKRVSVTNSLENYPELAAQWHPTRNGDRTPATVIAGFARKAWWKCPEGPDHEWESTGDKRMSGSGCPFCAGRMASVTNSLENYPDLAAQWHPTKNGGRTPAMVNAGSADNAWWKCPEGPDHEWEAVIVSRKLGNGCPCCKGLKVSVTNDLNNYPDLAREFHTTRNGNRTPGDVVAGTNKLLWWHCGTCGREWESTGNNRVNGRGCRVCSPGGFDPSKDGWLYLMGHDSWGLLQIGISNVPEDRVSHHERSGWTRLDLVGPMPGDLAEKSETAMLRFLWENGATGDPVGVGGRFSGYTESWPRESLTVATIRELMDLVEAGETRGTSRA